MFNQKENEAIKNEALLKSVYSSIQINMKNESEKTNPKLAMFLCNATTQIQLLSEDEKLKLHLFSEASSYSIDQLIDILEGQYNFFNSFIFNLFGEEFKKVCSFITSNKNVWNLFISFPNVAKKLIEKFKDDEEIDIKAENLLILLSSNKSYYFLKHLFD